MARGLLRKTAAGLGLVALGLLAGCAQEIVVASCDASHVADAASADVGSGDPDAARVDVGAGDDAGGPGDAGSPEDAAPTEDAGAPGCNGAAFCIRALTADHAAVNVRQLATLTPEVIAGGRALTFSVETAELRASRRAGLPALRLADVRVMLAADPTTGVVTFAVTDVPPWFATTTFSVTLHARAGSTNEETTARADVTVRGNVLFSNGYAVYAVASDGRPAHSVNFTQGKLIEGSSFAITPKGLLLARDGTLLVYDTGASPERIRRFELTGENVGLGDLSYDGGGTPYIYTDQSATGLTQLMDGRIALATYAYGRTPDSGIVLWNKDGTYDRTLDAIVPDVRWQGLGASQTANELLVVERSGHGRLVRLDPDTGAELGVVATDVAQAWSVLGVAGGGAYVGIDGAILRVSPQGGKAQVSMLMGSSADYWYTLAAFHDGQILGARDTSSESANIAVIDGTTKVGWLRPPSVGGADVQPTSVVYLE